MSLSNNIVVNLIWFRTCFFVGLAFVASSGIVNGQSTEAKIISAPEFTLSPEAEAAGIDGSVRISATLKKDGSVKSVEITAGPAWPCDTSPKKELEAVRQAVKDNALAARFQPAMKNGKAIEADVSMTFVIGEAYRKRRQEREREEAIAAGKLVPATIQGGVLNGRAISLPKPVFPLEARAKRARGSAAIEVLIDESGKVIQAGAVSGWHFFQRESRLAACEARFSPTLLNGKPVKVSGVITYNFDTIVFILPSIR